MFRNPDIREEISGLIDVLVEMYNETDPSKGEESEYGKLETARQAVEKFWYVFGRLLLWAQCHITGYCIARENPKIREMIEKEFQTSLNEDSHLLEVLGLLYPYNPVDREDPQLNRMEELLHEVGQVEALVMSYMRSVVVELLMARDANTSYWRFDIQQGLRSLNEGEVEPIFAPSKSRLRGKPATLNRWKLEALRQVYFRVGKGMKKHRALIEVGEGIGQSAETLRDWEKKLLLDEDRQVDLYCSQLAGEFDPIIQRDGQYCSIPDSEEYGVHRGLRNASHAVFQHQEISKMTFDKIKNNIRENRLAKDSGV